MALSPSETLRVFAQVVEHSPDLISVVDRQYVYRVVNPAYAGLGLYITRMLVRAHGGSIRVESEPGQGSIFHFTLLTA